MSFPSRILALLTGGAAAQAVAKGLEPRVEEIRQDSWRKSPVAQLEIDVLAQAIAQQLVTEGGVAENAASLGYSGDKVAMAAEVARSAPDFGEIIRMYLRGLISQEEAQKALRKHSIPDEWHGPLLELEFLRLSPADLANTLQQNVADGFPVDTEAKDVGLTADRLQLLYRLAGFPPPTEMALMMWRRGIIDQPTFDQMIREGRTKDKYIPVLEAIKTDILSPATYVTAYLKGWITVDQMNAGVALSGFTPDQADLMFKAAGRPASPGEIATANARNIPGPDGLTGEALMQKAVEESDIRPEWGPLIYGATRYTYPPLFQVNRLVTSGAITPQDGLDWLSKNRLAPEVLAALAKFWEGPTGAKADKHVTTAETQLFTATHKAYVGGGASAGNAQAAMSQIGIDAASQGTILALWDTERSLASKHLSAAQIKRAYKSGELTQAEALSRLEALGYSAADATIYLLE